MNKFRAQPSSKRSQLNPRKLTLHKTEAIIYTKTVKIVKQGNCKWWSHEFFAIKNKKLKTRDINDDKPQQHAGTT